tara:strand:+ start:232 stop:666 length:435 start_codon:yes stop_codon:yes gene_type:complete
VPLHPLDPIFKDLLLDGAVDRREQVHPEQEIIEDVKHPKKNKHHKENKDAAATTVSMAVTGLDPMENPMPLVLSQNHVVTEVHEVPLEVPDRIIQEQNKTELRDHLLNLKKIPWVILERMKEEIHPEVQCKLPKVPEVVEETNV